MSARLEVDWTRCDGHGLCAQLWGERIGTDPWGFPLLPPELGEDEMARARQVVGVCPALALRLQR
ncbi:ferredoxin [Nocardioides sp. Kera G14]|uniref:ferredoxin n=1 Tax=Nocardioides sp. Kera G14 TaxID=2884264 RepID=UPI001D119721|nr:ferredoxin [Nocardioides sp. Kera G14]UDY22349.1 ferredoxin [Nocardioides sp. Kera G14]